MRAGFSSLALLVLARAAAQAEEPSPADLAAALSIQPGVAIMRFEEHGLAVTEWRKNGVQFRREQGASKDAITGADESGHGAGMCAWSIFVELRQALNSCPADRYRELRADLDEGIAAMDVFIVKNSVLPVTQDQLNRRAGSLAAQEGASEICGGHDLKPMIDAMDQQGREARRRQVSDIVSTPRWPVFNPCL